MDLSGPSSLLLQAVIKAFLSTSLPPDYGHVLRRADDPLEWYQVHAHVYTHRSVRPSCEPLGAARTSPVDKSQWEEERRRGEDSPTEASGLERRGKVNVSTGAEWRGCAWVFPGLAPVRCLPCGLLLPHTVSRLGSAWLPARCGSVGPFRRWGAFLACVRAAHSRRLAPEKTQRSAGCVYCAGG